MNEPSRATPRSTAPAGRAADRASEPRHGYERAFYGDGEVLTPESVDELSSVIEEAYARRKVLVAEGAGSHSYLGVPPEDEAVVVSTRRLRQVLRYEPDDFTIGVQAGLPLVELGETLARNRQEIPIDFSSRSRGTVGGWVAAGFPGPRSAHHGDLRNYVIGAVGLRGGERPSLFKTGGMVVKNVAGYDVGKFLIGSLGTAGVILETNFKVRALPDRRTMRLAGFTHRKEAWSFARALRDPGSRPVLLLVLGGEAPERLKEAAPGVASGLYWVAWSFEGNASQVEWQESRVDAILSDRPPAEALTLEEEQVAGMRDALCAFSEPHDRSEGDEMGTPPGELGIARLGVLPTEAESLELTVSGLPESESAGFATVTDVLTGLVTVRWRIATDALDGLLSRLRAAADARQATSALLYLPPAVRRAWPFSLARDPAAALAERVRRVFDPENLFCPGRKRAT